MYQETTIKEIAEQLRWNKEHGRQTVFLIGAGVSVSAGIPAAEGMIEYLKKEFPELCKTCTRNSYPEFMSKLTKMQRRQIINDFVDTAKINPAHLYLSTLIKHGFSDRVLTTNFDTLLSKALALQNVFPGIYDFAASQHFYGGEVSDNAIFHLHGQKDGFVLLNTEEEVRLLYDRMKNIFDDSMQKRTWIIVGYSGENDPVFKRIAEYDSYESRLYWIGYKDNEPKEFLHKEILDVKLEKYAHYLKGFDADNFFLQLCRELKLTDQAIISKPFSYFNELVDNIGDFEIDNQETSPTMEIKQWIDWSRRIFERNEDFGLIKDEIERERSNRDLIKQIRESWIENKFDEIEEIRQRINKDSPSEVKEYYSYLLLN